MANSLEDFFPPLVWFLSPLGLSRTKTLGFILSKHDAHILKSLKRTDNIYFTLRASRPRPHPHPYPRPHPHPRRPFCFVCVQLQKSIRILSRRLENLSVFTIWLDSARIAIFKAEVEVEFDEGASERVSKYEATIKVFGLTIDTFELLFPKRREEPRNQHLEQTSYRYPGSLSTNQPGQTQNRHRQSL